MHTEEQQLPSQTWEVDCAEREGREQHQATLEQLISLNVQNLCPEGRDIWSNGRESISVWWREKATEQMKKGE